MNSPDLLHLSIAVAVTAILVWAGISDVRTRKIPNGCAICIIALFAIWAISEKGVGTGSALAAAAISFVIGFGLYSLNLMGAGDVKLFSALALFTGLELLGTFTLATAVSGGVVALTFLITRPARRNAMVGRNGKGDHRESVPYGVAIGLGALMVVWGGVITLPSL